MHHFGDGEMQPLDGERGRNLADEAAGVGETGLHRQAAAAFDVIAVGFLFEQALHEPRTAFEAGGGFKQRRDIDDLFDAEQLGEEDCDQHCGGTFAFGNQEADGGPAIDVLLDLSAQRKLADSGCGFEFERAEVDALVGNLLDHLDDAGERLAL